MSTEKSVRSSSSAVIALDGFQAVIFFMGGIVVETFAAIARACGQVWFVEQVDNVHLAKNTFSAPMLIAITPPTMLLVALGTIRLFMSNLSAMPACVT